MAGLCIVWVFLASACSSGSSSTAAPVSTSEPEVAPPADDSESIDFVLASGSERSIPIIGNGEPPALPAGAVPVSVEIDGEEIFAIRIAGDGPPIVLLHGFPDNLGLHDRLYPELENRHVVAFDFVGWGRSSKPLPSNYEYSAAQQTRELGAVMDALQLDDVVLVGHDASGPPVIDYTAANPDRVGRLVLLNTYYGPTPTIRPPEAILIHADEQLTDVEIALDVDRAATEAIYRFQMNSFIVADEREEEFIDSLWSQFGEARPAFIALNDVLFSEVGARLGTASTVLGGLEVPVDIVFGADDPYLNPGVATDFATQIPHATLTMVDGAAHFVQVDAPEVVAAILVG